MTLNEILDLTEDAGVTLRLTRVKPAVNSTVALDGVVQRIGADRIHGNIYRAVRAQLGEGH